MVADIANVANEMKLILHYTTFYDFGWDYLSRRGLILHGYINY